MLVAAGTTTAELDALARQLDPSLFGAGVAFLGHTATATSLSDGILTAARRISEIVAAMRSYTYLDRGAWQTVDVTEGIESTLVLMRSNQPHHRCSSARWPHERRERARPHLLPH